MKFLTDSEEFVEKLRNPFLCPTCLTNELDVFDSHNAVSKIDDETFICKDCGLEEQYSAAIGSPESLRRKERYLLAYKALSKIVDGDGRPMQKMRKLETWKDNLHRLGLFNEEWVDKTYEKYNEDLIVKDSVMFADMVDAESAKYPDEELDYEELERRLRYRLEKERQERG